MQRQHTRWAGACLAHLRDEFTGDAGHDLGHLGRVFQTAKRIADSEGEHDADVLEVASLLHDLVSLPKNHPERHRASRMSADAAVEFLSGIGFPVEKLPAVAHAIEAHSFSANVEPRTPEARALQDADRLDALGAIGVARCFAISGALGRAIVDGDDPLAERRDLDEGRFALDHFQAKLLKLPATMRTESGRRIGEERAAFVRGFMLRIADECSVSSGVFPEADQEPSAPGFR